MRVGNWNDINWARCLLIAIILWLLMYLGACTIGGILAQ